MNANESTSSNGVPPYLHILRPMAKQAREGADDDGEGGTPALDKLVAAVIERLEARVAAGAAGAGGNGEGGDVLGDEDENEGALGGQASLTKSLTKKPLIGQVSGDAFGHFRCLVILLAHW